MQLKSYVQGRWHAGERDAQVLRDATTGQVVAEASSSGVDFAGVLEHARRKGGPALRQLTFHERAALLKRVAKLLTDRKDEFYALSYATGATKADSWIDIDGGFGTLFAYASRGHARAAEQPRVCRWRRRRRCRRPERSSGSTSACRSKARRSTSTRSTSRSGACSRSWRRRCSPACPRSSSLRPRLSYLTELVVRRIVESGILPEGALQLVCGSLGDLFDHLTCQDVVAFTGSASTAQKLRTHPTSSRNSVRFISETDSLNSCVLGPDAAPGTAGVRRVRARSRARDDGEGRPEMHRDPQGDRAGSARRSGGAGDHDAVSPRSSSAIRASSRCAWARLPRSLSAARCSGASRSSSAKPSCSTGEAETLRAGGRGSREGRVRRAGAAVLPRCREGKSDSRGRSVRTGVHGRAVCVRERCDRLRARRRRQPRRLGLHGGRRCGGRVRARVSRRFTAACWS